MIKRNAMFIMPAVSVGVKYSVPFSANSFPGDSPGLSFYTFDIGYGQLIEAEPRLWFSGALGITALMILSFRFLLLQYRHL